MAVDESENVVAPQAIDSRPRWWRGLLIIILTCAATAVYFTLPYSSRKHGFSLTTEHDEDDVVVRATNVSASLPPVLMENVYTRDDFRNERGIVPSFWEKKNKKTSNGERITWGPCYPPIDTVDWDEAIDKYANQTEYHPVKRMSKRLKSSNDLWDYCRPGFIIIGAGKCGTSSLYHYLGGHPRVLPASQKQIHYFKVRLLLLR